MQQGEAEGIRSHPQADSPLFLRIDGANTFSFCPFTAMTNQLGEDDWPEIGEMLGADTTHKNTKTKVDLIRSVSWCDRLP